MATSKARKPKSDLEVAAVGDWLTKWHPGWFLLGCTLFAWWGMHLAFIDAAVIAVLLLALVTVWRVLYWRHRRVLLLAEAGMANPGMWRLLRNRHEEFGRLKTVRAQWEVACQTHRLTGGKDKKVPTLYKLKTTADLDVTCEIRCAQMGVSVDDVAKNAARIAEIIGAREMVVRYTTTGRAQLTIYWTDPMGRVLPIADLPEAPTGHIAYGIRRDGSAATVEMGLSVLLGGLTRHGKSNAVWAMLADLIRQNVPVDLYVSDPKEGMELRQLGLHVGEQMGCVKVRQYVTNPEDTVTMVKTAANAMRVRMSHQTEKNWTLSLENPLVLVILDELLPLHEMIKQGHKGDLGKILYTGSGAGYAVIANAQSGHAEILGILRNFIPQRICFRTKTSETTDTILGTKAEAKGALCSKITERGIAYAEDEFSNSLDKVRAALVGKDDIDRIAIGEMPEGMDGKRAGVIDTPYGVYRLYNSDRELLYIGISNEPLIRFGQHAADKPWWFEVDETVTRIVYQDSKEDALKEEERAIKAEGPRYNEVHNKKNPMRVDWRQAWRGQAVLPESADEVPAAGVWPLLTPEVVEVPVVRRPTRRAVKATQRPVKKAAKPYAMSWMD